MNRRRVIWFAMLIGIGVALAIAFVVLQHWIDGNNTGTVHVGTPTKTASNNSASGLALKTKYFETTLPAGFAVKRQVEDPSSSARLQLSANTPSAMNQQFSVTVADLPAGGITEVGDYHLRSSQPTTYTSFTPANLPAGATAFKTVDLPMSFTMFWSHGDMYAEISLSTDGVATSEQLQTTFSQAVRDWKWL